MADGATYLLVEDHSEEWLEAVRGKDGTLLWRFQLAPFTPPVVPQEPVLIDGTLYAQTCGGMNGGSLVALRASDGKMLWSQRSPGEQGAVPAFLGVADGVAYLSTFADNSGTLLARQINDGKQLWAYGVPTTCRVGQLQITDGVAYMSDLCGTLGGWGQTFAFRAADGTQLWQFTPGGLLTVAGPVLVVHNAP